MMNFAIVGTNFISDRFAMASAAVEDANIYAVYSRREYTGYSFAQKYSINQIYTDYEKMLSDKAVDAVYIASPTLCHKEHAIKAMQHGKAVLCEKMIVATEEEFYELEEAKLRYGGIIVEAMRCDFDPILAKVREFLSYIGKIKHAEFEFCQYSSRYDKFLGGTVLNAFDPKMKNSALADIGIYPLHFCIDIFGKPCAISSKSVFLHNGFESSGEIVLDYGNFNAKVSYSKTFEGKNVSFIEGDEGSVTFGKINEPQSLILKRRGQIDTVIKAPTDSNNMTDEIREFIKIARGDKARENELFALSGKVMACVGEVYRQNNINF